MTDVWVEDFIRDWSPEANHTAALQTALNAAGAKSEVRMQGDTVLRITPGMITLHFHALRGMYHNSIAHSKIVPADNTRANPWPPNESWLIRLGGAAKLCDVAIDCEFKIQTGLFVTLGHDCTIEHVHVYRANNWGMYFHQTTSTGIKRIVVHNSKNGFRSVGCNATVFDGCVADYIQGTGFELVGIYSGETTLGGRCTMQDCIVSPGGLDGVSPLVIVNGIDGGEIRGGYFEGGTDGMHIKGGAHNVSLAGVGFIGNDQHYAVRVFKGKGITLNRCYSPGLSYRTVWADAVYSREIEAFGSSQSSSVDTAPWKIIYESSITGDSWQGWLSRDGALMGFSHPGAQLGWWRVGKRIEHANPILGQPLGWINRGYVPPDPDGNPWYWNWVPYGSTL